MKKFDDNARCPKCTSWNVRPKWADGACEHWNMVRGRLAQCPLTSEHLHKICESCGYSWVEAPADAEESKP